MTRYEALRAVRDAFPSEQAMADAFGVTQPTIWRWLNQSKQMPGEFVPLAVEFAEVTPHDLRPDIYPRGLMVDQVVGARFEGVDRQAGLVGSHGVHPTRITATGDFNRGHVLQRAAQ